MTAVVRNRLHRKKCCSPTVNGVGCRVRIAGRLRHCPNRGFPTVSVMSLFKSSRRCSISPGMTRTSQKKPSGRVLPSGRKMGCCSNHSGELSLKFVKRSRMRRICSPSCTEPICSPPVMAAWAGFGSIMLAGWQRGIPPVWAVSCSWKSVRVMPNCESRSCRGLKSNEAPAGTSPLSISTIPGTVFMICSAFAARLCSVS